MMSLLSSNASRLLAFFASLFVAAFTVEMARELKFMSAISDNPASVRRPAAARRAGEEGEEAGADAAGDAADGSGGAAGASAGAAAVAAAGAAGLAGAGSLSVHLSAKM
jgi:hypothetical protein